MFVMKLLVRGGSTQYLILSYSYYQPPSTPNMKYVPPRCNGGLLLNQPPRPPNSVRRLDNPGALSKLGLSHLAVEDNSKTRPFSKIRVPSIYCGYMGIMERKMETSYYDIIIWGYIRVILGGWS